MKTAYQSPIRNPLAAKIIGIEHLLGMAQGVLNQETNQVFPPFNLLKVSENDYRIEVAVAGFSESELSVETKEKELCISGQKETATDDKKTFMHQGIAARSFKRQFVLSDYMEVRGANLTNGVLTIELRREVPESQRFRSIKIEHQPSLMKEDVTADVEPAAETSKVEVAA